jgi:hypothetical protein
VDSLSGSNHLSPGAHKKGEPWLARLVELLSLYPAKSNPDFAMGSRVRGCEVYWLKSVCVAGLMMTWTMQIILRLLFSLFLNRFLVNERGHLNGSA